MAPKAKKSKMKKSTQTYTCVDLYEGDARNSGYHQILISRQEETPVRVSILKGQYSSTFIINRRREGVSKNGIPWKKWEVWGQVIMSTRALNKAGVKKLNLYGKYRMQQGAPDTWHPFQNITSNPHLFSTIVAEEYIMDVNREIERLMQKNIGTPTPDLKGYSWATPKNQPELTYRERAELNKRNLNPSLYPMHTAYPLTESLIRDLEPIPSGIISHFRHNNMMDAVRSMYGAKLYRKDLVRAISEAPLPLVSGALLLKGVVPIDWIIGLLKDHRGFLNKTLPVAHRPVLRAIFKALTPAQQKRFLNGLMSTASSKETVRDWIFVDTLRQFKRLQDDYNVNFAPGQITAKTWLEFHDDLTRDLSRRKVRDQPIEKVSLAKKIDKVSLSDGYSIILPKTTHELIDWGRNMEHCIGSYTDAAVQGESVFLGIIKDKKMIGNAQISVKNKRLVQIFGKKNSYLDKNTLEVFSKALVNNKVIPEDGFKHAYGFNVDAQRMALGAAF